MSEVIGFIGLGKLGLPMAANLLDAGHALRVYNRTAEKAAPLVARGARQEGRAVDTVTPGGVVVSVLWGEQSVEELVTEDGFLERLGRGGVHVAMSTVLPAAARRIAELHAKYGASYVEATVFGRPEAAVARKLWMPLAGDANAKARVRPLLEAMGAQGIFDFGEAAGAATTAKIAGNFLLISAARSLQEALTMVEKTGGDARAVLDMLTSTLLPSPFYIQSGKSIVDKVAPMQSPIPLKDVGLFLRTAEEVGSPAPLATRIRELLEDAHEPRA